MALVTIRRSPSLAGSSHSSNSDASCTEDEENGKENKSLNECYPPGKGIDLMPGPNDRLPASGEDSPSVPQQQTATIPTGTTTAARTSSGEAIHQQKQDPASSSPGLPSRSRSDSADERESVASAGSTASSASSAGSDIQQHLQSMFYLLRPEETLKMAVKLESLRAGRTRYLVVVSRPRAKRILRQLQHQQQLQQQQLQSLLALSCSMPTSISSSSSVSPAPIAIPISKQITSASLYKAASPSTSSCSSVLVGVGVAGDETFVTSLDNCVLSASPKNASIAVSSVNNNNANSNNKCVDKCDSYRPSSNCGSNCNISSSGVVSGSRPMSGASCRSDGIIKVCSTGSSGFINVTTTSGIGVCKLLGGSSPPSVTSGSGSSSSLGSSNSSSRSSGGHQHHHHQLHHGCYEIEESCLLGIDCNEKTTVGLVLRVLADTTIRLDGDGGFSFSSCGQQHIFKPVSVQAMWSALQTLHKVSSKAREHNFFAGGSSHDWVSYYENHVDSDRSCLNEWHAMDSIESRRPPSPDSIRNKPTEREETERVIRTKLKGIMMTVDLDVVTSKFIRGRLEEQLDMDLGEYKSFIDEEMLVILGQMDAPTEIFDHVYLGSEWNASNLEELQRNGVRHILNVTREIDNFFPGMFDYFNVRVYDDEKTDLLKHWDNTFKYISRAKMEGSKVLVHCKMGISRSASVVIAYAMKANDWDFNQALRHVKEKRSCIKPNKNFIMQLETYQGMLDAMKNREKLQRSKSETNLKSGSGTKEGRSLPGSEPTPLIQALNRGSATNTLNKSGRFLRRLGKRPKSWSPDSEKAALLLETSRQQSHSLEHLMAPTNEAKTIRMPCGNGQNYSVSQNQIVHLQEGMQQEDEEEDEQEQEQEQEPQQGEEEEEQEQEKSVVPSVLTASSVRSIISELESSNKAKETSSNHKRKGSSSSVASATGLSLAPSIGTDEDVRDHLWDPGENNPLPAVTIAQNCDTSTIVQPVVCWTSQSQIIQQIPPVLPPQHQQPVQHVSRQSSWSSVDSVAVADMIRGTLSSASRNSSWGSGDSQQQGTRMAPAPPSRNSSWGSYDTSMASSIQTVIEVPVTPGSSAEEDSGQSGMFPYDKDEIPWHPGTVKRTKQKIEERSTSSIKRICSDKFGQKCQKEDDDDNDGRGKVGGSQQRSNSEEVLPSNRTTTTMVSTTYTRLSASAPDSYCLCPFGGKKFDEEKQSTGKGHHRRFSFRKNVPDEKKTATNDENTAISVSGIVKNLKMSFEAKVGDRSKKEPKKVRSLPSSPVAIHTELSKQGQNPAKQNQQEDITVRDLVDRYEAPKLRASFNTHHRHNSSSGSSTTSSTGNTDQVVLRQRPRSVFEPFKYKHLPNRPMTITNSFNLLRSADDFSRPPPFGGGGPFVRSIIGPPMNTSSNSSIPGTDGGPGPGSGTGKKIIQYHGKTHPLAKINLTKHRINATSTTAATAYNTM